MTHFTRKNTTRIAERAVVKPSLTTSILRYVGNDRYIMDTPVHKSTPFCDAATRIFSLPSAKQKHLMKIVA